MVSEPLSIAKAAKKFRLSPKRLRRAVACGELPASRPGQRVVYVFVEDVVAWLRRQRVPTSPTAQARATQIFRKLH